MLSGSLAPCCVLLRDAPSQLPSSSPSPIQPSPITSIQSQRPFPVYILHLLIALLVVGLYRPLRIHSFATELLVPYQPSAQPCITLSICRLSKPVARRSSSEATRIHSFIIGTSSPLHCVWYAPSSILTPPTNRPSYPSLLPKESRVTTSRDITSRYLQPSTNLRETERNWNRWSSVVPSCSARN
jgi:hypothetical protein